MDHKGQDAVVEDQASQEHFGRGASQGFRAQASKGVETGGRGKLMRGCVFQVAEEALRRSTECMEFNTQRWMDGGCEVFLWMLEASPPEHFCWMVKEGSGMGSCNNHGRVPSDQVLGSIAGAWHTPGEDMRSIRGVILHAGGKPHGGCSMVP